MKLIIDIPEYVYEWVMNTGKFGKYHFDTAKVIRNGTPLDDVKAEIEESRHITQDPFTAAGLETALEILDNVGKGVSE